MEFVIKSLLLGVGLAMDAFSVSLVSGMSETRMKTGRMCGIAGVFAAFQAMMPMIGWVCVHSLVSYFNAFSPFIPWIAFGLLAFIGGKMLIEGLKPCEGECQLTRMSVGMLMLQGVATSIDALSVGFTISDYNLMEALGAVSIIAVVTFIICLGGIFLGKKFGNCLAGKANMLGGLILIGIGCWMLIKHFWG